MVEKQAVKSFWDRSPCGTRDIPFEAESPEFFEAVARERYE